MPGLSFVGAPPQQTMRKYTLPANCSIERVGVTKRDRAFRLIFQADEGEDYTSEVYVPLKGESIKRAAYEVCVKFDWIDEPPRNKGRLITNLAEFLGWRGFSNDEPYYWARCFYKYTGCGPWTVFLLRDQEAHDVAHGPQTARFRKVRGKAVLENVGELSEKFVQFLSYDAQGLSKKERTWKAYNALVDAFAADEAKQARTGREIVVERPSTTELRITTPGYSEHFDETYQEVYYEDMREEGSPEVNNKNCVGIKFGSIVEGSDACSGPFVHMFPFASAEFDRDVAHMEAETSFYWERDNGSWYAVRNDDTEWIVVDAWGDIEWKGTPPPEEIKAAAEAAIEADWQDDPEFPGSIRQTIPEIPSMWQPKESDKTWEAMPLGDTGAEIYTFTNDLTYD